MSSSILRCSIPVVALTLIGPSIGLCDVKVEERSQFQMGGTLGKMVNLMGGKGTREGVVSTEAVRGNRKMSRMQDTATLVDLNSERIYEIDLRRRTYKVETFEERRKKLQDLQKRVSDAGREGPGGSGRGAPDYEYDFDVQESGQRKKIGDFDTRELTVTIAVREKGKSLEQGGGTVLTGNLWLAPKISAIQERYDFETRYWQKLAEGMATGFSPEQMAQMSALYPGVSEAMAKFREKYIEMDGTAIITEIILESVAGEERRTEAGATPSLGRLMGGLGRLGRGRPEPDEPTTPGRTRVMTITQEILSVSQEVTDEEVSLPVNFKERK